MYVINKIVGLAISPLGILVLGVALGWLLCCIEHFARVGRFVIGITIAFLLLMSCNVSTRVIGVPLEGEEAPQAGTLQVGGYDAVVLLGGGMGVHAKCGRAEMFGGADRVWHAAKLWKAYHAEGDGMKMTLSGGDASKSTIPLLRDLGVEGDVFLMFEEARNTEEEARMIAAAGIKRILLVTSAWHMKRAKMLFERAGFEVTAAPCDYEMHCAAEYPIGWGDFLPSVDALARNSYAIKEWIAYFGYKYLRK